MDTYFIHLVISLMQQINTLCVQQFWTVIRVISKHPNHRAYESES